MKSVQKKCFSFLDYVKTDLIDEFIPIVKENIKLGNKTLISYEEHIRNVSKIYIIWNYFKILFQLIFLVIITIIIFSYVYSLITLENP